MRTYNKEYFYFIQGLVVPKNQVNDLLNEDLEFFVDWAQSNTERFLYLLENHIEWFILEMKLLNDLLGCIYAKWLKQDAAKLILLAEAGKLTICQKLLEPLIVSAQTLAIDIQMAKKDKAPKTENTQNNELVNYKDIVSSMKIVLELLENSDFDKAYNIAINIIQLQDSSFSAPFMEDMASRDADRLKELASGIISLYTGKIDDINDSGPKETALKKLLIVDDMPEILSVMSGMLKDHYQVFPFTSSRQALDFIDNTNRPDAFILDIVMPDMNGFELAGNIRGRTLYKNTPIIFLTGSSARETVEESLKYGAKAFFVKPASKDIILSKLRECLP